MQQNEVHSDGTISKVLKFGVPMAAVTLLGAGAYYKLKPTTAKSTPLPFRGAEPTRAEAKIEVDDYFEEQMERVLKSESLKDMKELASKLEATAQDKQITFGSGLLTKHHKERIKRWQESLEASVELITKVSTILDSRQKKFDKRRKEYGSNDGSATGVQVEEDIRNELEVLQNRSICFIINERELKNKVYKLAYADNKLWQSTHKILIKALAARNLNPTAEYDHDYVRFLKFYDECLGEGVISGETLHRPTVKFMSKNTLDKAYRAIKWEIQDGLKEKNAIKGDFYWRTNPNRTRGVSYEDLRYVCKKLYPGDSPPEWIELVKKALGQTHYKQEIDPTSWEDLLKNLVP